MKKPIQIILLCFLLFVLLCIVFADFFIPLIPHNVRTKKTPSIPQITEDVSHSSTHVHPVVSQPPVSGTKPCFLTLNGIPVFGEGSRPEEILKKVFIIVRFLSPEGDFYPVETEFVTENKIIWCPLRSSWGPSYQFSGIWECVDGNLFITGHYEPTRGATKLPSEIQNLGNIRFLVTESLLGKGYPPYTNSLSLWLKRIPEKEITP